MDRLRPLLKELTATSSPRRLQLQREVSDLDLRLLRVFRAVVQCGGITAAEVDLNKSKSAISMDISALESRLGVTLCRRGRSGFALTREGELVHAATMQLFSDLDRFNDQINLATSILTGSIRIELDDSFLFSAEELLSDALCRFTSQHPQIYVDIHSTSATDVERNIVEGKTDLGLTAISKLPVNFTMISLFREDVGLYCGRGHPLFARPDDQIELRQISDCKMIDVTTIVSPEIKSVINLLDIKATAGTDISRLLLVLSGNYLGFIPSALADLWVRRDRLRRLLPDRICYANTCSAAWKKDAPANLIRDTLVRELKKSATRLGTI